MIQAPLTGLATGVGAARTTLERSPGGDLYAPATPSTQSTQRNRTEEHPFSGVLSKRRVDTRRDGADEAWRSRETRQDGVVDDQGAESALSEAEVAPPKDSSEPEPDAPIDGIEPDEGDAEGGAGEGESDASSGTTDADDVPSSAAAVGVEGATARPLTTPSSGAVPVPSTVPAQGTPGSNAAVGDAYAVGAPVGSTEAPASPLVSPEISLVAESAGNEQALETQATLPASEKGGEQASAGDDRSRIPHDSVRPGADLPRTTIDPLDARANATVERGVSSASEALASEKGGEQGGEPQREPDGEPSTEQSRSASPGESRARSKDESAFRLEPLPIEEQRGSSDRPIVGLGKAGAGTGSVKPATLASAPALASSSVAQEVPESAQIVTRGLSAALNQRGGVVHVRLSPASLGSVRIEMVLEPAGVSVRIEASTASAQRLLSEHLSVLRSSLEQKGLAVERLSVHVVPANISAGTGSTPQSSAEQQGGSWGQGTSHDAGGAPSRGGSDDDGSSHGRDGRPPEEAIEGQEAEAASNGFGGRLRLRLSAVA